MIYPTLLPPASTDLEKALEQVGIGLTDLPTPIRDVWSPQSCPIDMLPWLAWGVSIDLWDSGWSEAQKRAAVADAIEFHRRKGTPVSLRIVIDRIDPLIGLVEWFQDRDTLDPYMFRLELPLRSDSDVIYDEALVAQILRDIAQVKPVRAHMQAVFRVAAQAQAWLVSFGVIGGHTRLDSHADMDSALDPIWARLLQTEDGEPIFTESHLVMEH